MYLGETTPAVPPGVDWAGVANSVPSILDSIMGFFGKKPTTSSLYSQLGPIEPKKSNTIYYVVGGVLVLTVVGTIIALNRKKNVSSRA